jgi:hypothetical protein
MISLFAEKIGEKIGGTRSYPFELRFVNFHAIIIIKNSVVSTRPNIVQIMKAANLYNIDSDSAFERRSSTVKGWLNWILGLINVY